jgi:hypothetical protein
MEIASQPLGKQNSMISLDMGGWMTLGNMRTLLI